MILGQQPMGATKPRRQQFLPRCFTLYPPRSVRSDQEYTPPGTPPRISLTAPWTAPGGPGPYSRVLGSFSSVVAYACWVTRPYAGPCPCGTHTQHRAGMRYRDPEAHRLVGNGSYCLGWVLGVIRGGPHAREQSATRFATLGTSWRWLRSFELRPHAVWYKRPFWPCALCALVT